MNIRSLAQYAQGIPLLKKLLLCLIALAVCMGLVPQPAHTAWADSTPSATAQSTGTDGTATLQIVFGIASDGTPNTIVDTSFTFYKGATYKDLLDAAVADGSINAYVLNDYGYLTSITKADGTVITAASDYTTYWSNYENGSYYQGSDTIKTEQLVSGTTYQIAWNSYPTAVAPDWSKVPAASSADAGTIVGEETTDGTATLQIAFGNDAANLLVNKQYNFSARATYKDLLDAAVADGSINAYVLNDYGYLTSITKADGTVITAASDYTTYWSNYENGSYYQGSDTIKTEQLVSGTTYQIAWNSYPTAVAPDWSKVPAASEGTGHAGTPSSTTDSGNNPTGGSTDTNKSSGTTPNPVNSTATDTLLSNIATSYANTNMEWESMDMAAAGFGSNVDTSAAITNAISAYNDPDSTNLQRSIITLTALGIDATKVTSSGATYNMIDKLATTSGSQDTLMGRAFTLLAYECGSYAIPADALYSKDELIDLVAAAQLANGAFVASNDADSTAMMIPALAPYYDSNATAKSTVDKTLAALQTMQKSDGGFASSYDTSGASNADSTAITVVALCAMGIDPAAQWVTTTGATPLSALLSFANTDNTAFLYNGKDNKFATEQGFRALIANRGLTQTGKAYNIYIQAKNGLVDVAKQDGAANTTTAKNTGSNESTDTVSTDPADLMVASTNATSSPLSTTATKTSTSTVKKSASAATGDTNAFALTIIALLVISLGAVDYARRQRKEAIRLEGLNK
jgi:hypothetical protein